MNYRPLGRTGLQVSEIGLGSEAFVKQDDAFAQGLLKAAREKRTGGCISCGAGRPFGGRAAEHMQAVLGMQAALRIFGE